MEPALAVSFDLGQTLVSLDPTMLARRLAERALEADPARLDAALPGAFAAADATVRAGGPGHPWKLFMATVLGSAGVVGDVASAVDWLWDQQPTQNLWRRPIPGMIDLCRELVAAGIPVGLLTNSEGRAAELIAELGWSDTLRIIADSGRLQVEKPDPAIFAWMVRALGFPAPRVVHVGDSVGADIQGALRAGLQAVWFGSPAAGSPASPEGVPDGVPLARDAHELRAALRALGLPLGPAPTQPSIEASSAS